MNLASLAAIHVCSYVMLSSHTARDALLHHRLEAQTMNEQSGLKRKELKRLDQPSFGPWPFSVSLSFLRYRLPSNHGNSGFIHCLQFWPSVNIPAGDFLSL